MKYLCVFIIFLCSTTYGAEININPNMEPETAYTAIEAAVSGDVVVIEPGVYKFRLYLRNKGVIIKGKDPVNKPVFDYTGMNTDVFPGTDVATLIPWALELYPRDKLRLYSNWAWQIQANDITIENIEIAGARQIGGGAAIYIGPLTIYDEYVPKVLIPKNITLRNVTMRDGDEGLGGMGENILVDDCILAGNGSNSHHNAYIQGGTITFRNSTFDRAYATNLQSRARITMVENCYFGSVGLSAHNISIITDKAEATRGVPFVQQLFVRDSLFSGERNHINPISRFVTVSNSNGADGWKMKFDIELSGNSMTASDKSTWPPDWWIAAIHFVNRPNTIGFDALIKNNEFYNLSELYHVDDLAEIYDVTDEENTFIPPINELPPPVEGCMCEVQSDGTILISLGEGTPPLPPPEDCAQYDLNLDGVVNPVDRAILLNSGCFNSRLEECLKYDFDNSGKVDAVDVSLLVDCYK